MCTTPRSRIQRRRECPCPRIPVATFHPSHTPKQAPLSPPEQVASSTSKPPTPSLKPSSTSTTYLHHSMTYCELLKASVYSIYGNLVINIYQNWKNHF